VSDLVPVRQSPTAWQRPMARRDDWLLYQLPVAMTDDSFFVRFLSIFQEVSNTVLHTVDNIPHLFDTAVAPDRLVRAIGSWLGIDWIDPSLPIRLQRDIVRNYASIVPWRGTAFGLERLLTAVTQGEVRVEDSGGVYRQGEAPYAAPHVKVTLSPEGWIEEKPGRWLKLWDEELDVWELAEIPDDETDEERAVREERQRVRLTESDLVRILHEEVPANVTFEVFVGERLAYPDPAEDLVGLAGTPESTSSAQQPVSVASSAVVLFDDDGSELDDAPVAWADGPGSTTTSVLEPPLPGSSPMGDAPSTGGASPADGPGDGGSGAGGSPTGGSATGTPPGDLPSDLQEPEDPTNEQGEDGTPR
jgi:phage tail-like protein